MVKSVAEQAKFLYDHLPERYIPWQVVKFTALLLQVSDKKAIDYLMILHQSGMVITDGYHFFKKDKGQKKVSLKDIGEIWADEKGVSE